MTNLQVKIPTDTWVSATWDEYLQIIENPIYAKAKSYYYQGKFRIEMSPLSHDHAKDNSLINIALGLFCYMKNIDNNSLTKYSPQEYLNILYQNSQTNHPLKIYDPLQTIHSFCNTLQTLWENREKTELSEFKIFKFRHEGILQGKKAPDDSWKTIIAYCGGKIEKKGKCGNYPLLIGREENCPTCGYLICPKEDCQFCQQNCQSYLLRKDKNVVSIDIDYNLPMIEF